MQTVINPAKTELEKIYRCLLMPSFRSEQMESFPEIVRGVQNGTIHVITLKDANQEYAATAVYYWYPAQKTLLLAYLAVSTRVRSKGLGTLVLAQAQEWLEKELEPSLILCEANDPAFDIVSKEYGNPVRRMNFYKNLGARIVDVPYFQTAYDDSDTMVNMWLLVLPGKYMEQDIAYNTNREVHAKTLHDFFLAYMETETEPNHLPEFRKLFNALKQDWIPTKEI